MSSRHGPAAGRNEPGARSQFASRRLSVRTNLVDPTCLLYTRAVLEERVPCWLLAAATVAVTAACGAGSGGKGAETSPVAPRTRGLELPGGEGAPTAASVYGKSVALVVGIDQYRSLPHLEGAVRDARAVARALRPHGFEVRTLFDNEATKQGITEMVGDVLPRELGEDDRVFLYFAGHGASSGTKDHRTGYLLPVDGRRDRLVSSGISMTELNNWLAAYPSKHVLFVADACYSGLALATRSTGLDPGTRDYLHDITTRSVRFTLVAGADDQEAHEWQGMGVFTRFLLEAMEGAADFNNDGLVTSDEIASHVKPRVAAFVSQNYSALQTPQSARTGLGEFAFFVPRKKSRKPTSTRIVTDRGPALRRIAGGAFTMGSNDGPPDEQPPREIVVKTFWLDETEVTVAQYRACVDVGECPVPSNETGVGEAEDSLCNYGAPHRQKHPINCVHSQEAYTFCLWAKKRLPTEEEWEFAARGTTNRKYPWGHTEPTPAHANACGPECVALAASLGFVFAPLFESSDGYGSTSPVGSYADGNSPDGVADLAGNVWEWTGSWYCPYGTPDCGSGALAIRGGSYSVGSAAALGTTFRYAATPDVRRSTVGFRCARSDEEVRKSN